MGTAPKAVLIYGYAIDVDDLEILPWYRNDYRGSCLAKWWVFVNNLRFDSFKEEFEWIEDHGPPVRIQPFGHDGSLGEIITSPNYICEDAIGEAKSIDISQLATQEEDTMFNEFITQYIPGLDDKDPSWILASLYF